MNLIPNTNIKILSAIELIDLLDSLHYQDDKSMLNQVNLLIEAISDYPINVEEPIDFLKELERLIGKTLTLKNIESFNFNYYKVDTWTAESLSGVALLFKNDDSKILHDVIHEISVLYEQKKTCKKT